MLQTTNFNAQKIDGTTFETYKMVVAALLIINQADRTRFFEKIFLVAYISPDMVFGMLFFTLSNSDINFLKKELW